MQDFAIGKQGDSNVTSLFRGSKGSKKIINKNVGYMFELLKCTCEGLNYADVLDSIYPSYILDIKLEKCVQTIKELYNMTQDN